MISSKSASTTYYDLENGFAHSNSRKKQSDALCGISSITWLMISMISMQMITILYLLKMHLPQEFNVALNGYETDSRAFQLYDSILKKNDEPVTFNSGEDSKIFRNLIIVPGHAITTYNSNFFPSESDEAWYMLDYQLHHDVGVAIVDHIKTGIELCENDPYAMLVFSGGQTRAEAGPKSEAFSYFSVAELHSWWGMTQVRGRATTEEYALDSFQNLLFSIARFYEITNRFPENISIVGFDFKQERFIEQHAAALRIPRNSINYVGLEPKGKHFDKMKARKGEYENSVIPFSSDPYGCSDSLLRSKRFVRNPYTRIPPYILTVPELSSILQWCGSSLFEGDLPWDKSQ